MTALYLHTLLGKLRSPLGVVLLLVGPVAIAVAAVLSPVDVGDAATGAAVLSVGLAPFVLAAGLVGRPVQSGEMITWITRPLTLPAILVARFAGVLTAIVVVGVTPLLLALPFGGWLDVGTVVQALATAVAVAATVAFLSCLISGYGDVVVTVLLLVVLGVAQGTLVPLIPWLHWPVEILARAAGSRSDAMLELLLHPTMASLRAFAFGLFRIAALLLAGAFILTRKDFSYGRG